jgi:tetratricopeptide (TPR) repeat protein
MKSLLILSGILLGANIFGQTAFEYYNIGLVKYNLDNHIQAISDFDKAIEINPEYAEAFNLRGASKFNIEDYAGAIEDYSRSIEISIRRLGVARVTISDNTGKAIESEKPSRISNVLATPYYNRALAKVATGDYEGAIEDYSKALENNSDLVSVYYNRAVLKYKLEDMTGACSDWEKAELHGIIEAAVWLSNYCEPNVPAP